MRIRFRRHALATAGLALPLALLPALPASAADAPSATVAIDGLAETIKYNAAPDEFTVTVKNPGTAALEGKLFLDFGWAHDLPGVAGGKIEVYDEASQTWKATTPILRNGSVGVWAGGTLKLAAGGTQQVKMRFGFSIPQDGRVNILKAGIAAELIAPGQEDGYEVLGQAVAPVMPDVVHVSVKGFPAAPVVGSGFAEFEVHVTAEAPFSVPFSGFFSGVTAFRLGENRYEQPDPTCQAVLQIQDATTKAWVPITQGDRTVIYKTYVSGTPTDQILKYRIALGATYPTANPHDLYLGFQTAGGKSLAETTVPIKPVQAPAGTKLNACGSFADAAPPPAGQPSASPSAGAPKPAEGQGPELAETGGSDSGAMTYGIAGAAVLVAGAGAVVFARRRSNA